MNLMLWLRLIGAGTLKDVFQSTFKNKTGWQIQVSYQTAMKLTRHKDKHYDVNS